MDDKLFLKNSLVNHHSTPLSVTRVTPASRSQFPIETCSCINVSKMIDESREVDTVAMEESTGAKDETSSSSTSAPRFEIKKWNAVTMWSWDICADTCAICRNSLNEPSIEYQVTPFPNRYLADA